MWGGVPAHIIGRFDALYQKRMEENKEYGVAFYDENMCWKIFNEKHKDNNGINGES